MEEGQFSNNSSTAHATSYDLQGIRGCTRHVRLGVRAADPPSGSECSAGSQGSHPACAGRPRQRFRAKPLACHHAHTPCHQLPPDASTCHRHRKGLASFAPFAAGFVRSALDALKMLGSVVQIRPCPPYRRRCRSRGYANLLDESSAAHLELRVKSSLLSIKEPRDGTTKTR